MKIARNLALNIVFYIAFVFDKVIVNPYQIKRRGQLLQASLVLLYYPSCLDIRFFQNHIVRSAFDDTGRRDQSNFGIFFQLRNI